MADPNANPSYVPIPFPAVYYSPSGPPVTVPTVAAVATLDPTYGPAPVPLTPDVLVQQANVAADLAAVTIAAVPATADPNAPLVLVITDNLTGETIKGLV